MSDKQRRTLVRSAGIALTAAMAAVWAASPRAAATVTIVNGNAAGVGFNDVTPVAPVGGNPGTTLGQQRLIAFQAAANKWGATLTSAVTIRVLASWDSLTCTATSAMLGTAGATEIFRDFSGAVPNRWYGKPHANKLFGGDQDPATADIRARFDINLGGPDCLTGTPFYLGLDNNHGSAIDLVTTVTHELAHGLGFQTFTVTQTGAFQSGFPSIFDDFLLDTTTNKTWSQMTDAERVASATNTGKLVWNGSHVNAALAGVLAGGQPQLTVSSPASVAGAYATSAASFGPALTSAGVTAEVRQVVDQADGTGLACTPLSAVNVVAGKIALIDRGTCTFNQKVANAQAAGAVGVIIVDNVAAATPPVITGSDPTITIPTVTITLANGTALKNALKTNSRLRSSMMANLGLNQTLLQGADSSGRALMYAPNPFQNGVSVNHWDTSAFRNQLMEPPQPGDLTHEVTPPKDLTFKLLQDIGW